jgi:hypothetical protein
MSAKNRKLVEFYEEQGAERGEQPPAAAKTASVNAEQMRRAEERMTNANTSTSTNTRHAGDRGASSVGVADEPQAECDAGLTRQRTDG